MNSNTSSTGGERQDRPGFGWAGRSAALSLWIISVLLWCVLMRQSFTAMPWDDMTVAGERLQELRRPFAAAGMAVGGLGSSLCLGCLFWLCLSSLTSSGWGIALRRVLAAGCWGFYPVFGIGRNGRLPDYRDFSGSSPLLGSGGCCLSRRPAFGVLDLADFSWWNPAWLYVRVGSIAVLSWSMAQVWETLVAEKMSGSLPSAGALPSSAWL